MDKPEPEQIEAIVVEEIVELDASPPPKLDTVFSNFFHKLEHLPPIPKPRSAKDYLESNRAKIIHALSKGYRYEDLAQMLRECGFAISASTLRRYVGPVKGRKGEPFTEAENTVAATNTPDLSALASSQSTTPQSDIPSLKPRRR